MAKQYRNMIGVSLDTPKFYVDFGRGVNRGHPSPLNVSGLFLPLGQDAGG